MSNNYSTPESALVNVEAAEGSLQAGITGDYDFRVFEVISEAWDKTSGIKLNVIVGGIIMILASMVISTVLAIILGFIGGALHSQTVSMIGGFVAELVGMAVTLPIGAGIFIICLKQVQGKGSEFGDIFSNFEKAVPLLVTVILQQIMVTIGFFLLIVPGIYLMIAYLLSMPLVIDRGLSPWEALEASRKAITKRWFSTLGLWIMLMLIMLVSMIPIGIGLIWTVPMTALAVAILYRQVFGIAGY